MAGGTGGHVFPALAVAQSLKEQGVEVTWLGTPYRMEAKLVPEHGFELDTIDIEGLRGHGLMAWLAAPMRLIRATHQAYKIIKARNPEVVLGMGGFASGPGGLAAWLLRKPLVIHEQNAVAGLTNRLLSHLACCVCESFPGTFAPSSKLHTTGNPVRDSIQALPFPALRYAERQGPLHCLILGGSLGAKALNETVPQALALLPQEKRPIIWHQCGEKHSQAAEQSYKQAGLEAKISPFIQDMSEAYAWADYVICRAGALTVTELMAAGLPALMIPFPQAVDDHQTKNAATLVQCGAADLIQQESLTAAVLAEKLLERYQDRAQLALRAEHSLALNQPEAKAMVANFCMEAANATL